MPSITIHDALNEKNAVFIDVRSQSEFLDDHIPGAINAPILDNEERHLVGYTYKRESVEKAFEIGYGIFDKKIKEFEKLVKKLEGKKIIFYCFRGGTRSTCFVDYFDKKGVKVFKLERGYKAYREYVREGLKSIELPKNIVVLYGLTGAGKTRIIKKLENSIDLEDLANHKSSLFGGVGLKPNSQKYFETLLFFELRKQRDYLVLEGESRKIGSIILPENLFLGMLSSKKLDITCPLELRAERIVEEYFREENFVSEIKNIVPKLEKSLGKKRVLELLEIISKKDFLEFSEILLKEYYDPRYSHGIKGFAFEKEISSEDLDKAVLEIKDYCKTLKKD